MLMNKRSPPRKQQQKPRSNPRSRPQNPPVGKQASVAAAYASTVMGSSPKIKATRDSCNIQHKEFIGNISGSVLFAISQALSVNPGLQTTFPWLSIMAQGWEEYRFRKLRFFYKTRTGSTTPGSVIMAPDYDAADTVPTSEQVMTTYAQVVEDAVWKDISCPIKTTNSNPLGKHHYVRTGPLAANLDIKTYDIATFLLATVDGTAIPWGKLWVEYDIDFFIPQLPPSGAALVLGGNIAGGGALSAANPLGTASIVDPQAIGLSIDNLSNVTFANPGTYLCVFNIGSATTLTAMASTAIAGCVLSLLDNVVINTAATAGIRCFQAVVSAPGGSFNVSCTAAALAQVNLDIAIAPVNSLV